MNQNKYSNLKIVQFPEKLASFRSGRIAAPLYVRVKPVNYCNHGCHWCCVSGTLVITSRGEIPIEHIKPGDTIIAPNGTASVCVAAKTRRAAGTLKITADGRSIEVTADHPFLTEDGWQKAGDLRVGMRTVMQVRVRSGSGPVSSMVERLCGEASAPRGSNGGWSPTDFGTDDRQQPDEKFQRSGAGIGNHERDATTAKPGAQGAAISVVAGADAIKPEPDEEPGDSAAGSPASVAAACDVEIRGSVLAVATGQQGSGRENQRGNVHRQAKPGLPSDWAAQGYRVEPADVLQQTSSGAKLDDLRDTNGRSLQPESVGLFGRLSETQPGILASTPDKDRGVYSAVGGVVRYMELRRIDSIFAIQRPVDVYNLWCPPSEAYLANGFAVHNCVYKSDRREPTSDNSPAPIDNTMHMDMVEKDAIPAEKLLEILDDFRAMGVNAVTYSGGGEPLLHKEIAAAMYKTVACGIDLSIITNGQNLDGKKADALGCARWVRVSMDYTTAEQMARFRRVPAAFYQKVIDNIGAFAKSKKPTCDLGINFIVHRDNCEGQSLVGFALMMKSLGVTNVRFSPMWCQDFHAYHESIRVPVEQQLRRCQELVDDTFSVNSTYDLNFAGHGPVRGQTRCLFAQTVPVIGADLNVYACHNKAYDKSGLIGSIRDQSFKEMWFSNETAAFFKRLNPNEDCRHQCANHNKVAIYNELTEASYDNFV